MRTRKTKTNITTGIIAAMLLIATVLGAVDAHAFRIGNYDVGIEGIKKTERVQAQPTTQAEMLSNQDIGSIIGTANADQQSTRFMKKHFSGDTFCISTESRTAILEVMDTGEMAFRENAPKDCYPVRTTEQYLLEKYQEYQDTGQVSMDDLPGNVKASFRLRARFAYISAAEKLSGVFS